jgi:hypothetical protein
MYNRRKSLGSKKLIHIKDDNDTFSSNKKLSIRLKRVFFAILDLMKTTNGIDKVLRFFQYFSYIQQFRMKLLLNKSNIQGNGNCRVLTP